MMGEYKLLRQGGGRAAFAHVYVDVVPWDGVEPQVITSVDLNDQATTLPEEDPEWFDAAMEGCRDSLSALRTEGIETNGYQVQVIRIIFTYTDTNSDVVRAAAFLATAAAFSAQERFRLVFQDGWKVVAGMLHAAGHDVYTRTLTGLGEHTQQQIIYELPQALAGVAAPLFQSAWFDQAFIDAFFEGRDEGRLFVDDLQRPGAALLCRTFEYYVAGDPGSLALRQLIKDAPAEAGVFEQLYGYCPVDNAWVAALMEDQEGSLHNIGRIGFKYPHSATLDWQALLPKGAVVKPIDGNLAGRIDAEFDQHIGNFWNGYDRFAAGGFGFCTLIDGAIASIAYAIAVSSKYANIGVETAPPFRRQGLCTLTSAAFIDYCLQHGLIATWDSDTDNAGSLATARKLGFQEYPPFSQLSPHQNPTLLTSQGRWSKAPSSAGVPAEVTIWQQHTSTNQ